MIILRELKQDIEEEISSQVDGIKTLFTISNNYKTGTIKVFLNGQKIRLGITKDYTEVLPNQILFALPVKINAKIEVQYSL